MSYNDAYTKAMKDFGHAPIARAIASHHAEQAAAGNTMIKPSHRGLLREHLDVPKGKPIPDAKLNGALKSRSPAIRREAQFDKNMNKKR